MWFTVVFELMYFSSEFVLAAPEEDYFILTCWIELLDLEFPAVATDTKYLKARLCVAPAKDRAFELRRTRVST